MATAIPEITASSSSFGDAASSSGSDGFKSSLSGPLSVRQTRMMEVANLYIHRGDSKEQQKSFLESFEQLSQQFKALMEYYEECKEARMRGKKVGCSAETWEALTRKVTGKGPSLRKALEVRYNLED